MIAAHTAMRTGTHGAGRRPPTRRACEAASRLGLLLDDDALAPPTPDTRALLSLREGEVALVQGPSGAGKSTLLHAAARAWRERGVRVVDAGAVRLRDRAGVDHMPGRVEDAMRRLARFGLAEARCFVQRPSEMSEGQRARLALAVAADRAARAADSGSAGAEDGAARVALLVDEFASSLDDVCAAGVARALRRFAEETRGVCCVCATTREGLAGPMGAHVVIDTPLLGGSRARRREGARAVAPPILIRGGSARDYEALAALHYRAGAPAAPARVLTAWARRRGAERAPIGVLVVAMPTLNGAWRARAWPGAYDTGDRRADVARLNAEVRTIARVVVDPRWRSCAVEKLLVRAYLRDPLTRRTEALAAMGPSCPFLERAGMTPVGCAVPERDARLLDALAHCGVEAWRLATPSTAWARAVAAHGREFIEQELRRWANASRANRAGARLPAEELFRRACRAVGCAPTAYTHDT